MKIVILGDGLLGKELKNQTGWNSISRSSHNIDFNDVTSCYQYLKEYDVIINCIAHTDTYDKNKDTHWAINYKAVSRLSDWCTDNNKKLVQISTDYVYANTQHSSSEEDIPVHAETWYGYTKLLADGYIELKNKDYLIIRCGHKPTPFPYDTAYGDIYGNFDYVNVIAAGIISLVNKNATGLYNVGTESKTIYDLAIETRPDVKKGLKRGWMPGDVRMDCNKFKNKTK
tara:strand:- start:272 stop:955 length:684 start_codon:yes stop_codon:yes gene_type:complete